MQPHPKYCSWEHPEEGSKAGRRAAGQVCEGSLRTLRSSSLEKRLGGDLTALCHVPRRGSAEAGTGLCSLVTEDKGAWEWYESAPGGSDRTLEKTSLPGGWSNTGTGFLERWSMPQACQHARSIWIGLLKRAHAPTLMWSGSWTRLL